jgi:hypothetical protein
VAPWPEALAGYERSFRQWIEDWRPIVIATEATVINRTQAYAGTLDTVVNLQLPAPANVLVDFKTGNRIYPEVALQLAALSRGEFVAHPLGRIELPMPQIDLGAVLHLTPTGYDFKQVRIDDAIFNAFQYAREVFRFRKQTASTVFIADLKPRAAA